MKNQLFSGMLIGAAIVALVWLAFFNEETAPVIHREIVTQTDTLVMRDTVRIVVKDSVFIKEYVPVIKDSIAVMDTTIRDIEMEKVTLDAHVAVQFDLRKQVFRDLLLGFPKIAVEVDTIYIKERIEIPIYVKPSKWKYVQAGVIGAAVGIVTYALIQGI